MKIIEEYTTYVLSDAQMPEWRMICKAFAKKMDAELLFVDNKSCGIQTKDGQMHHIYVDEMYEFLGGKGL